MRDEKDYVFMSYQIDMTRRYSNVSTTHKIEQNTGSAFVAVNNTMRHKKHATVLCAHAGAAHGVPIAPQVRRLWAERATHAGSSKVTNY